MGPQPHVRSCADVLFEHLHVLVCEVEIRMLCRGVRHWDELAVVVTSARACHVGIVDHCTELLCHIKTHRRAVDSDDVVNSVEEKAIIGCVGCHEG